MDFFNQQISEKFSSLVGIGLGCNNSFAREETYSTMDNINNLVNKSYTFKKGMIIESVFDTDFIEDVYDFCEDYVKQSLNSLILVANDNINQNNILVNIILKLKPKYSFFVGNAENDQVSNSLTNLVKKAYNKAKDGSTLLICNVDKSFDLLSCVFS